MNTTKENRTNAFINHIIRLDEPVLAGLLLDGVSNIKLSPYQAHKLIRCREAKERKELFLAGNFSPVWCEGYEDTTLAKYCEEYPQNRKENDKHLFSYYEIFSLMEKHRIECNRDDKLVQRNPDMGGYYKVKVRCMLPNGQEFFVRHDLYIRDEDAKDEHLYDAMVVS